MEVDSYPWALIVRGCTSDRGHLGHEVNPCLDQAMEYAASVGSMCLGKIANTYNVMENWMLVVTGELRGLVNTMDVRMEEVDEGMCDFDMRMAEVEERVGAAERTHDAFEAFVDGFDPRVHRLEWEVWELQQQVGKLLMFWAILQHGPGNPVVVEDEEDFDEDLAVPDFPAWVPGGGVGQLVPIEDGEENELLVEVVMQQIIDEGGPAPLYEPGEEVPGYEEAPEYQISPVAE